MRFTMRSRFSVSLPGFCETVVGRWSLVVGITFRGRLYAPRQRLTLTTTLWFRDRGGLADDWRLDFPHRPPLNPLFIHRTLKDAIHKHARRVHRIRIEFTDI